MISDGIRMAVWGLFSVTLLFVEGLEWLTAPVCVPLGGVLALTFVPLGTINRAVRGRIEGGA